MARSQSCAKAVAANTITIRTVGVEKSFDFICPPIVTTVGSAVETSDPILVISGCAVQDSNHPSDYPTSRQGMDEKWIAKGLPGNKARQSKRQGMDEKWIAKGLPGNK